MEFGIGRPAYRERHYYRYYDDEPYAYSGRVYRYDSRPGKKYRYHRRGWDWD